MPLTATFDPGHNHYPSELSSRQGERAQTQANETKNEVTAK